MYRLEITIPCTSTTGGPSSASPPTRAWMRPMGVSVHTRLRVIPFDPRVSPRPPVLVAALLFMFSPLTVSIRLRNASGVPQALFLVREEVEHPGTTRLFASERKVDI